MEKRYIVQWENDGSGTLVTSSPNLCCCLGVEQENEDEEEAVLG